MICRWMMCLVWLLVGVSNLQAQEASSNEITVRYPSVQHPYYTERDVYFVKLLRMALEHSGENFKLVGVKLSQYSEKRSVLLIKAGQYDVHWLNTTAEREQALLPVRIPLYKGVIGWRAFLIQPSKQEEFSQMQSVEDLKKMVFAQGHDWADVDILLKNGFAVERSSNWAGLFQMVLLNRAQAFPRSIVEIVAEQQREEADGLVIEKDLILNYPAAYYFFVGNENPRLQTLLRKGLMHSIEDGSFDKLFYETFGAQIAQLKPEHRRVMSIPHPNLQNQMPIDDARLWFSVDQYKNAKKYFSQEAE